ncbi:FG-GAP-like repeat-containing protein [Rubripirellula lacrimiformis]|nr:FG-GAP-like repeat-containing protein [Rubripirellula lacrimiformis]
MSDTGPTNTKTKIIAAAIAVIAVAAIILWLRPGDNHEGQNGNHTGPQATGESAQQSLSWNRSALAATENLETESADETWDILASQSPNDESILLNRALNRILRVDHLAAQVANPSLAATDKQAARSQLPSAIAGARSAIDQYDAASSGDIESLWMRTRIDLREASLLPASMTKSLRREIFTRLSDAIRGPLGNQPQARILGGSMIDVLTQMEDPIDGLPTKTLATASATLKVLSDRHPDNLFFALRAARLGIETKDKEAGKFVLLTGQLASAVAPLVGRETRAIGMTPDELVASITAAIESDDWSTAETRMLQWFNVLNGTEIVKTDRRLAAPHPLDHLSFDSLRRVSAAIAAADPVAQGGSPIQFDRRPIDAPENQAIAATIDFDLDLDSDLVTVGPATDGQGAKLYLLRNDGDQQWTEAASTSIAFVPTTIVIADLFMVDSSSPDRLRSSGKSVANRHNTLPCLVLCGDQGVSLVAVDGRTDTSDAQRLLVIDSDTGLSDVTGVQTAIAGDLDADGDLDLVFATQDDGVRMFVNRGNRTFFELPTTRAPFGQSDAVTSIAIGDLDRDLDLDLVTTHESGHVGIIENLLHLQFRGRILEEIPVIEGASAIAIEDVDGNVSWDLIVGGPEEAAIVFSQTADAGAWTIDRIERSAASASEMSIADLDNDSWLDLITNNAITPIGPWGFGQSGPGLHANDTPDDNGDESTRTPSTTVQTFRTAPCDFNDDGVLDFALISDGTVQTAINRTDSPGHHINVRFKGIDDNATGRVNHFAIGSVLELRFGPHYRARIVQSPSTHFGIDGFDDAGDLRAILPNGLTQTTRDIQPDTLVEEEQTLKGSCPYLYAWDGEQFQFVTDCLWAAPLGLQVADGIVAKDRPWEYLKIDGRSIRPRDGRYEFRVTEELWEVAYFDEIKLSAVDHPADVDVWTNEKVGPGNLATPTIFAFDPQDRRPAVAAVDTNGNDVLSSLAQIDGDSMQGFDRRLRQGLCPPHWVDLQFDALSNDGSVYLVMTGWILPTDTSLNIQIDQNDDLAAIEFPSVWVPDDQAEDGWRNAIPFAGFPGGKTKTIVIDVTDIVDRDDPRLRVRTSAQIYWDAAELVTQQEPATYRSTPLELVSASVDFHGFSARSQPHPRSPETYDYQNTSSSPRWPPLRGKLTGRGDCIDLLAEWDDRMVVIGAGDEIRLSFAAPPEPVPDGWVRDFVMHNVGWDKDADLNTLAGQTIGPLPYRSMTSYPPPANQQAESENRHRLNADHRQREQSFRQFWHRPTQPIGSTAVR